jgi:hypothetical protein
MRIGLIPLDERPANTRYPQQIAMIAGVDLQMPPSDLLSQRRTPAPADRLGAWLDDVAPGLDALIVSFEMLGYGGLIASRISDEPAGTIIGRLDRLRRLRRDHPYLRVFGFNVVTRVSNADDAIEEPTYWATYGQRLYRLSGLLDRASRGEQVASDLATLQAEIPADHSADFLRRRLRNHAVNLAGLGLLDAGVLDLLVLSSDDTSPVGLPSREKQWLSQWAGWLQPGERLLMYPGADEVGCALLARVVNESQGYQPPFDVRYALPDDQEIVAPYEDGPVRITVERQIRAIGGRIDPEGAGLVLAVNPPVPRRSEWHPDHAVAERQAREPDLERLARAIAAEHLPVIVADVAYPNGSDPVLIELLQRFVALPSLAAYGGWNTAGNTIGTALAQGCAARFIRTEAERQAQEIVLLHRFLEDWGYQQVVRREVRAWLVATSETREPTPENLDATRALIEARLGELLADLPGFSGNYRIVPGSTRLPWQRTFEVDFELERVPTTIGYTA